MKQANRTKQEIQQGTWRKKLNNAARVSNITIIINSNFFEAAIIRTSKKAINIILSYDKFRGKKTLLKMQEPYSNHLH